MQKKIILIMFLLITTIIYSQNPCPDIPTVNYAGKIYNTVQIGTQCWLKENLNVGSMINGIQNQTNNNIIEKYCYNDSSENCEKYGGLYQWAEAVQYANGATNSTIPNPAFYGNVKGICPDGWHIPTLVEFQTLLEKVNNNSNALKALGQGTGAGAGTNTSGFSALLSGYRYTDSNFYTSTSTNYWSISDYTSGAYRLKIWFEASTMNYDGTSKISGYNIRCLKDDNSTSVLEGNIQSELPMSYSLSQNYPNPFNPTTTINYSIPKQSNVTIKIYDALGREVATVLNENKSVGKYSLDFDANTFVSGIYFYQLQSDKYTETKKFILLK